MITMKKSIYSLAIAIFGSMLMIGCDESDDLATINEDRTMGNPTVTIAAIKAEGTSTVIATMGALRTNLALEIGVMIFENDEFTNPIAFAEAELDETGLWTAKVEKLQAGTKYYARAYAYGVDGYIVYSRNALSVKTAAPETWAEIGTGTFKYNAVELTDGTGLTYYRSERTENRYKIAPWYNKSELIFTVNADNTVEVEEQETGYLLGSYGMVYVTSADKLVETATKSYYDPETKTYTFNLYYYVYSNGKIAVWKKNIVDTFTID